MAPLTDQIGYAVSDGEQAFPILAVPYVPTYQLAPATIFHQGKHPAHRGLRAAGR